MFNLLNGRGIFQINDFFFITEPIDSVISVNLYQISFLKLFMNIYKKFFIYLKTYINGKPYF